MPIQTVDERPHYTIRLIKNIGIGNKIEGKILAENFLLVGDKKREEWIDKDGKKKIREYYEHVFPCPKKKIKVGKKIYEIQSIDVIDNSTNKIINVI